MRCATRSTQSAYALSGRAAAAALHRAGSGDAAGPTTLMDEPASALDPSPRLKIEELMLDLAKRYTIVIVTHNMQQAARVGQDGILHDGRASRGLSCRVGPTETMFTNPNDKRSGGLHNGAIRLGKGWRHGQSHARSLSSTLSICARDVLDLGGMAERAIRRAMERAPPRFGAGARGRRRRLRDQSAPLRHRGDSDQADRHAAANGV